MRPIKLTMSAFGPYADVQVIEFDKLGSKGLYLVTGDTGAGKTTIFDAISFALYDDASGQNRKPGMLRSKYANDSVETFVELVFEYRGQTYTVKRNPEYMRPAIRGTGLKKQQASAELTYPDGSVISRRSDVNKAIEDIIGVDRNQFGQIAMIAQGDFQRLLHEKTDDRKKIFRKIFKTDIYSSIQFALNEKAKKLGAERSEIKKSIRQYISGIQCAADSPQSDWVAKAASDEMLTTDVVELLENLIAEDGRIKEDVVAQIKLVDAKLEELTARITTAKEQIQVANALDKAQGQLAELQPKKRELEAAQHEAHAHEPEIEHLTIRIEQISQQIERFNDVEKLAGELTKTSHKLEAAQAQLTEAEENVTNLKATIDKKKTESKSLEDAPLKKAQLEGEKERTQQNKDKLVALNDDCVELERQRRAFVKAQEEYIAAASSADEKDADFRALRKAFRDEQAGIMAETLEDGMACPVCGSTNHPHKAVKTTAAPTETEVNKAEEAADEAQRAANDKSNAANKAKGQYDSYKTNVCKTASELLGVDSVEAIDDVLSGNMATLNDKLRAVETGITEQNDRINTKKRIDDQLPELATRLDKAEDSLVAIGNTIVSYKTQIESQTEQQNKLMQSLEFADKQAAEGERRTLATRRASIETAIKDADKAVNDYSKKVDELNGSITALQARITGETIDDVNLLEEEKIGTSQHNEALEEQLQEVNVRIDRNRSALDNINAQSDKLIKIDEQYTMVEVLNRTASAGVVGRDRIELETYVQMVYLDRILRRANMRLQVMTQGQYELVRKESADDKRSLAGLDLNVLDHYNGTVRDVKTLSGGESFMASLSLALGLSDEVQQSAGGIRIDTLFVDEGFGSLDEDSLRQAMNALISLTEGERLVGIISHVAELKEKIDKQIIVTKAKSGGSEAVIKEE